MIELREVVKVKANDDFTLECEMENGEIFLYDMSSIKNEDGEMIEPLKKIGYFKKVFIEYDCPTWPNGFNVDATNIVITGQLIKKTA